MRQSITPVARLEATLRFTSTHVISTGLTMLVTLVETGMHLVKHKHFLNTFYFTGTVRVYDRGQVTAPAWNVHLLPVSFTRVGSSNVMVCLLNMSLTGSLLLGENQSSLTENRAWVTVIKATWDNPGNSFVSVSQLILPSVDRTEPNLTKPSLNWT